MTRQGFDFSRVLVSTSSFDVINLSEQILIDGEIVVIKIIEEWGFSLGEDACLFDEDEESAVSYPESAEFHEDIETFNNVDVLVAKIAKDLVEAEDETQNITWHITFFLSALAKQSSNARHVPPRTWSISEYHL